MKTFVVSYYDCGEYFTTRFKAEDAEHAEEKFWDWIVCEFGGPEGIRFSCAKVKN